MRRNNYLGRLEAVKAVLSKHFQEFNLSEITLARLADEIEDWASVVPFVDALARQNRPLEEDQGDFKWIASKLLEINRKLDGLGLIAQHALKECDSSLADCKDEILHLRSKVQQAEKISEKIQTSPTTLALGLPIKRPSKGRPKNNVQNDLALILARNYQDVTGKLPTITVDTSTDPVTRKGKYLALVRDVFEVYGHPESNAPNSAQLAVERIKQENRKKS